MPRRARRQDRTTVRKNAIFDLAVRLTEMGYFLKVYWRNINADIVASKGTRSYQLKVFKITKNKMLIISREELEILDNPDSFAIGFKMNDQGNRVLDFYIIPGGSLKNFIGEEDKPVYYISERFYDHFRNAWHLLQ